MGSEKVLRESDLLTVMLRVACYEHYLTRAVAGILSGHDWEEVHALAEIQDRLGMTPVHAAQILARAMVVFPGMRIIRGTKEPVAYGASRKVAPQILSQINKYRPTSVEPTTSAMFCEHANEAPAICPCPPNCYCRVEGGCSSRPPEQLRHP